MFSRQPVPVLWVCGRPEWWFEERYLHQLWPIRKRTWMLQELLCSEGHLKTVLYEYYCANELHVWVKHIFLSLQGGKYWTSSFCKKTFEKFGTNSSKYLVVHTNNTSRFGICVWAGKPGWQQYQLQGCGPSRRDWSRGTLEKNVVRIISTF